MRFMEIVNPEDQLALWRLISDNVWSAFGQTAPQPSTASTQQPVAPAPPKPVLKSASRVPAKSLRKGKTTPAKKAKPRAAPMAPAPKPLPNPKPIQPTQAQDKQAQTQQHQHFAHHIQQALSKKPSASSSRQPTLPKDLAANTVTPINSSYSERDKDDLVLHKRENPLKPFRDEKPFF